MTMSIHLKQTTEDKEIRYTYDVDYYYITAVITGHFYGCYGNGLYSGHYTICGGHVNSNLVAISIFSLTH